MKHQDPPRIHDDVKLLMKDHPNKLQPETELKIMFKSMKMGISPDGIPKIIKKGNVQTQVDVKVVNIMFNYKFSYNVEL